MDSEWDAINAVGETLPNAAIVARYLHLGQAVYRRAQILGMVGKSGAGDEFKAIVHKITALAGPRPPSI